MNKRIKKLTNQEISSFCSQMSMLLQAGIMPTDCMYILIADTDDDASKEILTSILDHCIDGDHFYKALDSTHVFPHYVISMITIGEDSGNLDEVMQSLADFYNREQDISDNIRSAVTYPFIMVFMMFLVITVLLTKVLPIFEQVFQQLGSELTGISLSLMLFGKKMEQFSAVVMVSLILLVAIILYGTKTQSGKSFFSKLFDHIPLFHNFFDKMAAGKFASGMALMLSSGIDISKSLVLINELVDNQRMREKIAVCRNALENGANLSESLIVADIFNNLYSRMVSVGFKSGNLPRVMRKIASCYENETTRKMQNFISILEPTLVIILSFIVGIILLSVILPLMSIMSSIG